MVGWKECVYVCVWGRGLIISYTVCNQRSLVFCISPTHSHVSASVNEPQVELVFSKVFAFLASSVSETAALSRIAVSFWMKCDFLITQWLSPPGLMGDGAGVSRHMIWTIFNTIWTTCSRTWVSQWHSTVSQSVSVTH